MTPHKETHPEVVAMMSEYYDMFDHIKGRQICEKAGIELKDLRLGRVCLNHILGKCTTNNCTRKPINRIHAKGSDAKPEQVTALCNKLRRGVNELTRAKRNRGGYDQHRGGGGAGGGGGWGS